MKENICLFCGDKLSSGRARYCNNAHRQAGYRARRDKKQLLIWAWERALSNQLESVLNISGVKVSIQPELIKLVNVGAYLDTNHVNGT